MDQRREQIQALLQEGYLQQVPASDEVAQMMLGQVRQHLASAEAIAASDPGGAYALAYDAARKGMAAVYEAQGLRATSRGGHVVLYDAARAQFDPPLGHLIEPFNRMRRRRNQVEYAASEAAQVNIEEVLRDITKARGMVDGFAVTVIQSILDYRRWCGRFS